MTIRGIQKFASLSLPSAPTLVGGAAGIGAMALTHSIMEKSLNAKRQLLDNAMRDYAKTRSVPLIAGAITALLVGSMVASKMRSQQNRPTPFTPTQALQQQQGFFPGERVQFGQPQSIY